MNDNTNAVEDTALLLNAAAARNVLWSINPSDPLSTQPGGFIEKLLDAWWIADLTNHGRLSHAFPAYGPVMALLKFDAGSGRDTVRRAAARPL